MPVGLHEGCLELRIFVDKSSVGIFIGDGEYVLTERVYPGLESLGIRAFASGKCTIVSFQKWDIFI